MENTKELIDPFPEEAIIKTEKEIEAAQITAAVFLRNYSDRVSPEVIKTAAAIESGEFLQEPVLWAAYENLYRRLLLAMPSGCSGGQVLNNLYRKLVQPFQAAGILS